MATKNQLREKITKALEEVHYKGYSRDDYLFITWLGEDCQDLEIVRERRLPGNIVTGVRGRPDYNWAFGATYAGGPFDKFVDSLAEEVLFVLRMERWGRE